MADRPWTLAEIERAVSMRKAGLSRARIAYALGRTEASVRSRLSRKGVKVATSSAWTDEEDAIVLARVRGEGWEKISEAVTALGRQRSAAACRGRFRSLKGDKPVRAEAPARVPDRDAEFVRLVIAEALSCGVLKVAA